MPDAETKSVFDLAASVFKEKGKIGLSKITFVGCSRWIMEEAKRQLVENSLFYLDS